MGNGKKEAPGTAVTNWTEKLGKIAQQTVAAEVVSGRFLSFKSGQMSFNDTPVPQNSLPCIIIAHCHERTFYSKPFNPNVVVSPDCYAFAKQDSEGVLPPLVPHPDVEEPIHPTCEGCPMDVWGSDLQGGRGKACKEIRRLAILPADALKDPDKLLAAAEAYARVPVMSVAKWSAYTHLLAAHGTAPFAAVTRMYLLPDAKSQFTVNFELMAKVTDDAVLTALFAKHEMAMKAIDFPYAKMEEQAAPPAVPAKPGKKSKVG
jgi:hypothetical protein